MESWSDVGWLSAINQSSTNLVWPDHVYFSPLSVDSRSTVGWQSADSRPTHRPTVDRLSTDSRPTVDRQSTDCRLIVYRQSTDSRSTVGRWVNRQSADILSPTVDRQSVARTTVGRLSADCRPTVWWLGRFRIVMLARKGSNSELYLMWGWEKCFVCNKESSWWNTRSR